MMQNADFWRIFFSPRMVKRKRGKVIIQVVIKCRCITWRSSVIGLVGLVGLKGFVGLVGSLIGLVGFIGFVVEEKKQKL